MFKKALTINKRTYCKLAILFLYFVICSSANLKAQGNLVITPKRVVFEGQKRSQIINLANIGKDTAQYVVSFIQIRMKDDGTFEQIEVPDPGQKFSDKNLRIFPRRVTLAPNEAQVVKVQLSQYDKLTPGEYRSHLYFRSVPKEVPLGEKSSEADSAGVSVRLVPIFGISIPIIIRSGEPTLKVSLSNLKLETLGSDQILTARFNRSGSISVYGDLTVHHVSNTGKVSQIALVKGISVYTPNKIRDMRINLDTKSGVNYRSGKLLVTYTTLTEGKSEKLATAELSIN